MLSYKICAKNEKQKDIYHLRFFLQADTGEKKNIFPNNLSQKEKKFFYFFSPLIMPVLPWLTRPQVFVTLAFICHPNVNDRFEYKKNTCFMPTECTNQRSLSLSRYWEFTICSWTGGCRWMKMAVITQPLQKHFLQVRKFFIYSTGTCIHVGGGAQQATVSVLLPWL